MFLQPMSGLPTGPRARPEPPRKLAVTVLRTISNWVVFVKGTRKSPNRFGRQFLPLATGHRRSRGIVCGDICPFRGDCHVLDDWWALVLARPTCWLSAFCRAYGS